MICPQCKEEGKTSSISMDGCELVTAMFFSPYYDEQGMYHHHDGNTRSTGGTCSNGHRLNVSYKSGCGSCDYGKDSMRITVAK